MAPADFRAMTRTLRPAVELFYNRRYLHSPRESTAVLVLKLIKDPQFLAPQQTYISLQEPD